MIEKKSLLAAIKRALQTGGFQLVGQQLTAFPIEVCRIDTLTFEDQNWWDCNPITKIDLSNNSIAELPAEITKLPDLQLIRLKNNEIRQLPPEMFELQGLKSLDLTKNKLQAVPQQLQKAASLVQLILSGNELVALPELQYLANLEILMVDSNKITKLPILPKALKRLDASSNQLTLLTRQQTQFCRGLEYLNLNKNHITEIEQGALAQCNSLVSLEIKENRLAALTDLPKSDRLDTITVSFNRIRQFEQFENCPNLTILILSDNKVEKLSSGIIHLKKLKTLDISNNDLSDLPSQLGLLPALVRIQLEGNPLKCIRQNVRTAGADHLKKYLKERMDTKDVEKAEKRVLDPRLQMGSSLSPWEKLVMECTTGTQLVIRSQGLQELDPCVFKPTVTVLNLTQNKLTQLSVDIRNMSHLKSLILNQNLFERLPDQIFRLATLEQLEVKKNKLDDFCTKAPIALDRLYLLDLSVNKIGRVPAAILRLPRLRILHLSYNKLETAEQLFARDILPLLEVLDLSNNHLSELPESVANRHSCLNFLNVENNSIGKLPTVLGFMKLTALKVDGNPLKLIKRTVIDKGTVALLEDLRTKHIGPQPVFEPVNKPPPLQKPIGSQDKMQCQEEQEYQPTKPTNLTPAQRNQMMARVQQIGQQISRIEQEVQSNMSMNRIQKADKKRQAQTLMIERNKLQQQLQ